MRKLLLTLAIAAIAAPGAARDRNAVPDATPDGQPVDCIQLNRISQTLVRNDKVIDFKMNGGTVYRNVLPQSCPTLGFEKRYLHKTSINQLCSIDTITVLRSPGLDEGPSCGLGEFQPVKLARN